MKTSFLDPLRRIYHKLNSRKKFIDSRTYWKDRYKEGNHSGWGSYNKFAVFKAEVINLFVDENDIEEVIEFGCGDGNQCQLFEINNYIGIDISEEIIQKNKITFKEDTQKKFFLDSELHGIQPKVASMSLDVIYHLVEDSVYEDYMTKLFDYSKKYVIIYSSNYDKNHSSHVKNRKFTSWIEKFRPEWSLIKHIPNKYPYDDDSPEETSWADFFMYRKNSS